MIRGAEVKICYDPTEFPDVRYSEYHGCHTADYLCRKFEDKFADKLCLYDDIMISKSLKVSFSHNDNKILRAYSFDTRSINLYYTDRFIKRTDLLPYFIDVDEYDDYVTVDGHYFPNLTDAFYSMFTVDGDRIIPKPWKPYHILASLLDLHSGKLKTLESQVAKLTKSLRTTKKKLKQATDELKQTKEKLREFGDQVPITTELSTL